MRRPCHVDGKLYWVTGRQTLPRYRPDPMTAMTPPRNARGFTLIELMIVVAVIGILAAIAMPSYNEYIRRGHRQDARAALLQAQRWLERAATATGGYPDNLPDALSWSGSFATDKRYSILYVPDGSAAAPYPEYELTANPVGVEQNKDICGKLVLKHTGALSVVPPAGVTTPLDALTKKCWPS